MNYARTDHDPFETLLRFQDDLSRAIGTRGQQPREHVSTRVWSPVVDVYEDTDAIVIKTDLPGVNQDEIDIEMNNDMLTIRGERKFDDEARRDNYVRVERQYGAFQRSFTIGVPVEPDRIKAVYKNGILELTLPKAEITKPRKVQVAAD
jgi:HSP20 family protein